MAAIVASRWWYDVRTMAARSPYKPPKFDLAHRIVTLRGKDAFLMREYGRRLSSMLEEAHGEIEWFTFDGATTSAADVLDELRSFGLLQQHKLVIVEHADAFLANSAGSKGPSRTRKLLEEYAQNPVEDATLLLKAEAWKAGKLDKLIAATGLMHKVDLDESTDMPFAVKWCKGRTAKAHDAVIDEAAVTLLLKRIGLDFGRLDSELGKLGALAGSGGTITRQHVIEMTGISREEQAWAIQEAVLSGRAETALVMLRELQDVSRQPTELILWSIIDLLRKLHATSAMQAQGIPVSDICRRQRLFGSSRNPVLRLAGRVDAAAFASLLRSVLREVHGIRSGYGQSARTLERMTIRIADTLNTLAA